MLSIYNKVIKLLSCFILSSVRRKRFRKKFLRFVSVKETLDSLNNKYDLSKLEKSNIRLTIDGSNNIILLGNNIIVPTLLNIYIYGDNNIVDIGSNTFIGSAPTIISFGYNDQNYINNASFKLGDGSSINEAFIALLEPNTAIEIGNNCMVSFGVTIEATDTHSIIDTNRNLINYGKNIKIGNHVWIGKDTKIGKGVKISDNSIIGWGSIVTKQFDESNVIIAGNPAKIVKRGVNWDRKSPYNFMCCCN